MAVAASTGSKKERKATAAARFTIYKVNKASRKKREKSSAKKERKATKTLAIVLGKCNRSFWSPVYSNLVGMWIQRDGTGTPNLLQIKFLGRAIFSLIDDID